MNVFNDRYLRRLLICLACVVALSQIWYLVTSKYILGYFSFYKTYNEIFEGSGKFDVLFMGSSRMKNHINPAIIDSILHENSFNAGKDGANIIDDNVILEGYLINHPPPKLLVISLDLFTLNTSQELPYYQRYIPYRHIKPVRVALENEHVHVQLYNWLPFLSMVDFLDDYNRGVFARIALGVGMPLGDFYYKGFESNGIDTIGAETFSDMGQALSVPITDKGKMLFNKFIALCNSKKIKLVFTYSPEFRHLNQQKVTNSALILKFYDSAANENRIPFLRHDFLPICNNPKLFATVGHLNRFGAQTYSLIMAKSLDSMKLPLLP
jgi:hypothetical protein